MQEEGARRFWKGSHAIALGCIPSHAGYFLVYEQLKKNFDLDNEEYDLRNFLMIGCCTTVVHDLFITPSDGKPTFTSSHPHK
jgi:hypothetical protein